MMLSSKTCDSAHHQKQPGFRTNIRPSDASEYVTSSRDTLQSIAVAFDTTTSKLMKLNRMSSLTIFPGQTLYVPNQEDSEPRTPTPPNDFNDLASSPPKQESWDNTFSGEFSFLSPLSPSSSTLRAFKDLVMVSSKDTSHDRNRNIQVDNNYNTRTVHEKRKNFESSGRTTGRVRSESSDRERSRIMSGESTESEPFEEGFLKMSVKYITECKDMISGVMLVTPTALMFDPDTGDPVVQRDGCDQYGIMCPMKEINSCAMYNDTSRMTSRLSDLSKEASSSEMKKDSGTSVANGSGAKEKVTAEDLQPALLECDQTTEHSLTPLTNEECETAHEASPLKDPSKKALPKPGKVVLASKLTHSADSGVIDSQPENLPVSDHPTEFEHFKNEDPAVDEQEDKAKLETEFPFLHSLIKTVGDLLPVTENVKAPSSSRGKSLSQDSCSNHMFLCIQARRPMVKTFSISEDEELLADHEETPVKSRVPEYWFQVPRKRSDHVYAFFLQWSPENNMLDTATELGFVVTTDEQYSHALDDENDNEKRMRTVTNSSLEFVDDFFDESYPFEKEWEIISVQEAKRRSIATNALELAEADDSLLPHLDKPSNILSEDSLLSLCRHLPNRCIGYSWYPIYTTYDHGTSLRTLYRNMAGIEAPVVLIIKDDKDYMFGALCSNSLHVSDHYYGTGESFLFTLSPEFEVFKWTGDNSFFIKGDTDSITFGGGKGTFGLWLDSDLYRGCSHPCETFSNKVLSCDEDFIIQGLEIWAIKD